MYEDDLENEGKNSGGETPAWMLTFADLVSLLICFFVLLYSMKSVDESIWQKISGSFAGALNYSQKFKKINPNNDSGVETKKMLTSDSLGYIESVLYTKFSREGLLEIVDLYRDKDNKAIHITIPAKYLFVGDSSELSEDGEKKLSFISDSIQYISDDLEIESYTAFDEAGLAMQNSILRALEVGKFIKRKGSNKKVKAVGFGSAVYDDMKNILTGEKLQKQAVKLDFIIKSKL